MLKAEAKIMLKKLLMLPLVAILCLFTASAASAQATQAGITPCGTPVTLSVTTSSSNAQLSTCNGTVVVWNVGSNEAFFTTGTTSGTVATTSNYSLPAGTSIVLNFGTSGRYLAAITASSTTTLRAWSGFGMPALAGGSGSGGGGGGSVTQGTVPWVDSVHYWGSADTALGAPSNYGTSPGAVVVPGVNAFVTNVPHVVCDSGCSGSGGTSSSFGSAFPSAGTAVGFTDGTNMVAGRVGAVSNVAAATTFVDALSIGQYLASAPTLTDTRYQHMLLDINGNLKVTAVANALPTGAATAANQATEITALATLNTSVNGPVPTQAPTVSIGGVGIIDSAGTNVATVKAASTLPVTTDKTLVVGLNPGTSVAGTPTGAIVTVQGVASMTPVLVTPQQGGAALSATNGGFQNILQGNAALSVSNPSFNRSVAGATGGGTLSSAIAPVTPAGVNLKASAGSVFRIFATTIQATPVYIKFYNASSAPTCGSGTPVGRFMVPVASTAANGAGTNIDIGDMGAAFGTGIGYCVTGALADNDTTAITANNTLVNIVWN